MSVAARRQGPSASAPGDGSRTMTIHEYDQRPDDEAGRRNSGSDAGPSDGTLRLQGGPRRSGRNRPRVAWSEDVVDNEGCGKKKSKICCIYHKPKAFDESSDESSSCSDSDSDSDFAFGDRAQPTNRRRIHHEHRADGEGGDALREPGNGGVVHELEDDSEEKNAYEREPGGGKGKRKS